MGVTDYGRGNKAITCRALGRRTRDSLFSWGRRTDGWVFFRGAGISSAIYVVSRYTSLTSLLLSAFGADRDKGAAVSASARSAEVRSYSLPILHINKSSELAVCVDIC